MPSSARKSIEPSIYLDALMNDFTVGQGRDSFDTPRDVAALQENVIIAAPASDQRSSTIPI
jgi:hypothetical protein